MSQRSAIVFVFVFVFGLGLCSPTKNPEGKDCSYDLCNVLGNDICQNGGTCTSDGCTVNCLCPKTYEGKHCEHRKEGSQRQNSESKKGNGNFLSLLKALVKEESSNDNSDDDKSNTPSSNDNNERPTNKSSSKSDNTTGSDGASSPSNNKDNAQESSIQNSTNEVNKVIHNNKTIDLSISVVLTTPSVNTDRNSTVPKLLKNDKIKNSENDSPKKNISDTGNVSSQIPETEPGSTVIPSLQSVIPVLPSESMVYPPRPEVHPNTTRNIAPDWDLIRQHPWQRPTSSRPHRSLHSAPLLHKGPVVLDRVGDNSRWTASNVEPLSFVENPMNVLRNLALAIGKQNGNGNGNLRVQPKGSEDVKNGRVGKYYKLGDDDISGKTLKQENSETKNIQQPLYDDQISTKDSTTVDKLEKVPEENAVQNIIQEFIFTLSPSDNSTENVLNKSDKNLTLESVHKTKTSILNSTQDSDGKTNVGVEMSTSEYDSATFHGDDDANLFINETANDSDSKIKSTTNLQNTGSDVRSSFPSPLSLPVAFSVRSLTKESMIQDTSDLLNLENSILPNSFVRDNSIGSLEKHLNLGGEEFLRKNILQNTENNIISPYFPSAYSNEGLPTNDLSLPPIHVRNYVSEYSRDNYLGSMDNFRSPTSWNREKITSTFNHVVNGNKGLVSGWKPMSSEIPSHLIPNKVGLRPRWRPMSSEIPRHSVTNKVYVDNNILPDTLPKHRGDGSGWRETDINDNMFSDIFPMSDFRFRKKLPS